MYITRVKIKNYKSFIDSGDIYFQPGINIVVGQNNSGKTALLEVIGSELRDHPHRSIKTVPTRLAIPNQTSEVEFGFCLGKAEFDFVVQSIGDSTIIGRDRDENSDIGFQKFIDLINRDTLNAQSNFSVSKGWFSSTIEDYPITVSATYGFYVLEKLPVKPYFRYGGMGNGQPSTSPLSAYIFGWLKQNIYLFRAERLNIDESEVNSNKILKSDASNLAQVLDQLQANPARFKKFQECVQLVFPQIRQVAIRPSDQRNGHVQIVLWTVDPESERDDLAILLRHCGTGISQVLAMLYVVLTSDMSRTIIIDEPNSFLHPGALRKLIEIFKQYRQHQYIVSSHTAASITSSNPSSIHLCKIQESESIVIRIDPSQNEALRSLLLEIGASLSDVFGCDSILWVEGATEEECFPLIWEKTVRPGLFGIAIIGVKSTGDLESRHAKTVFEIYRQLSSSGGLLPPAIGFIFDREGRSPKERSDMERDSTGLVKFLGRRLFENYLLEPNSIADLANSIEGFRESRVEVTEIESWLQAKVQDNRYEGKTVQASVNALDTLIEVAHGAKLLRDLFAELSENRVEYDKVKHGKELTKKILERYPGNFKDISNLMQDALGKLSS